MFSLRILTGLLAYLGSVSASALPSSVDTIHRLYARATVNGSCISAPDDGTTSLVGLCVSKIARGQIASNTFWTDPLCVAAATSSSMGSLLDAACCAGTCRRPLDIGNLDVSKVYRAMVGSGCTATTASTCTLTWQPFVDFIYGTIQTTNTQIWPDSGDVILDRWQEIATWTGFCKGTSCVDGAIPYSNFNDWFHFSSAVTQTTPGTPQFAPVFPTVEENIDITTPNVFWPCLFDDPSLCSSDWAPPPPGSFNDSTLQSAVARIPLPAINTASALSVSALPSSSEGRKGLPDLPANIPPPVYANGQLVPLVLNGTPVVWNLTRRTAPSPLPTARSLTPAWSEDVSRIENTTLAIEPDIIVPDNCFKNIDIPTVLPVLTYYCDKLPQICANIRSHPDWNAATDEMDLTYDPWDNGRRRTKVCTEDVTDQMHAEGDCDPRQHSPYHWKVSCDEFPFSASLEGGQGNTVTMAVSHYEQDLQGTLQSSIIHLRTNRRDKRTKWSSTSKCHRYRLKLVNNTPAGASAKAIGFLNAGSQFFADGSTTREVGNSIVLTRSPPPPLAADTPYPSSATALLIKRRIPTVNCAPCDSDSDSVLKPDTARESHAVEHAPENAAPTPTSFPNAATSSVDLEKRQASSCTISPTAAPLPTSSADASAIAKNSEAVAKAAAAAAAAALASVSNPDPALAAAAAAAAISAASSLGPAAAALAEAASDSALAAAIASTQSVVTDAQDAVSQIFSLGPSIPSWLSDIFDDISSAASSVATAAASSANVVHPSAPVNPVVDPDHDPTLPSPPPAAPPAACFGAGSEGFVLLNNAVFINDTGPVHAKLVDVGSNAYFGLSLGTNRALGAVAGCNAVYEWVIADLQPNFQVDCSTNELGSYWEGVKQRCYVINDTPGRAPIFCGNNAADVYACLQGMGRYGDVELATPQWATSI